MTDSNEKLELEVEKIPAGSEALRIVNADKEVRFVCISSPYAKNTGRNFWLGYGEIPARAKAMIRNYLKDSGATKVHFKRVKKGNFVSKHHDLKRKTDTCGKPNLMFWALIVSLLLNIWLVHTALYLGK